MNLPLHIARRYLFSKKSHSAINIISLISACGIIIASAALVCALSVFNGFSGLVANTFNAFDPELQITPIHGKVFSLDSLTTEKLNSIEGIDFFSETLEENALLKHADKQKPIVFRGVSPSFYKLANMESLMIDGQFVLREGDVDNGVIGSMLAMDLRINPGFLSPLELYVPKRKVKVNLANPSSSFTSSSVYLAGVFQLNQAEYDEQMLFIDLELARELLNYKNEVSALDIKLTKGASSTQVAKDIRSILGDNFFIKDRFEQQASIYNMMNIEKWVTFLILAIILAIATFNIVGSLSILIIDKKEDIKILQSMGADNKLIEKIFLFEGWMIVFVGAIIGIVIGLSVCLLQQHFGFIKLGTDPGAFVVDSYPVIVETLDIIRIFLTIGIIGFLSVLYPVLNLRKTLTV